MRKMHCVMSELKPEAEYVHYENTSLVAAVNEYDESMNNIEKKADEEQQNGIALPRDLMKAKEEMKRLG